MNSDPLELRGRWICLAAAVYLSIALLAAYEVVQHTTAQTNFAQQALNKVTLQNAGSLIVDRVLNREHPFAAPFLIPSVRRTFDLPSLARSSRELNVEVPNLIESSKKERTIALTWSWILMGVSLACVGAAIASQKSVRARSVILALTSVSVVFFIVGMAAPALAIVTVPTVPILASKLTFVLQCEIRSILSVILSLFRTGHWVLATLICGFSVVTPLAKTVLTLMAEMSPSATTRSSIVRFLHSIGRWSMADVLVAGVLLACFALESEQATKAFACLGLYYFVGYCVLSMITASLIAAPEVKSAGAGSVAAADFGPDIGRRFISASAWSLVGVVVTLAAVFAYNRYQQSRAPAKQPVVVAPALLPIELQNSVVNLPAHHWTSVKLKLPYSGILAIDVRVVAGNNVTLALIHADQLPAIEHGNRAIQPPQLLNAGLTGFRAAGVRNFSHSHPVEAGDFLLVIQDPSLGILSASSGSIQIKADLSPAIGQ